MKKVMFILLAMSVWLSMGLTAAQKTEQRDIGRAFSGIEMGTHGDLQVKVGDHVELVVEADEEMMPRIITEVRGNTLVIRRKEMSSSWIRDLFRTRRQTRMRFFLTVLPDQLDHLEVSSHGNVELPQLKGQRVEVDLSSHGDVRIDEISGSKVSLDLSSHGNLVIGSLKADRLSSELSSHGMVKIRSGQVSSQRVSLTSHGDYLAEELECRDADVELTSHGRAKVFATRKLGASMSSHGDLYYRGEPELDVSRSDMKHVHRIR